MHLFAPVILGEVPLHFYKVVLVNKIYLYDDKMTVLCNTQDGHFDVDLKEVSSLKGQLVEAGGVEPPSENVSTGTSPGADGLLDFPS